MSHRRRTLPVLLLLLVGLVASVAATSPAAARPSGGGGGGLAVVVPRASDWDPLTPALWDLSGREVVMTGRGTAPEGPRRPFEYAVLRKGPELGSLVYRTEVRIDEPVARNDRDVVLIWNYRSPTRFYYAHLSQDNTIYPHNGIFVVDDADRRRIDDQWDGTVGAPPAIDDTDWHDVGLVYDARRGRVVVLVDGEPLMTATDTTFSGGRVGFGSFDNYGRARGVVVAGQRHAP